MAVKKTKTWLILSILILISLHLKIFSVGDFGVALAFILIPFWTYQSFNIKMLRYKENEFMLIVLVFFLPFINGGIDNFLEFFRTYGQYIISYYLVARVIYNNVKLDAITADKALSVFQWILSFAMIIQFILVSILHLNQFYNIFGQFQLYYQRELPVGTIFRMKAFYLEPSYAGFVAVNVFWVRIYLFKSVKLISNNLFLTLIVLVLSMSASSFVTFIVIFLFKFSNSDLLKNKSAKFSAWFLIILLIYLFNKELFSLLRLNEFSQNQDGISSGFMRVILPIQVLYKLIFIDGHLFGMTFGQLDKYTLKYFIEYNETGISNSFLMIIGYWGILALFFYSIIILFFFKTKNKIMKSFVILSLLNLNNSGAFVTTQYVFIAFLLPILAIKIRINDVKKQRMKLKSLNFV